MFIRRYLVATLVAGALVAAACGNGVTESAFVAAAVDRSQPDAATTEATIDATVPFAFDLYRELASGDENLVFSPHSIAIALAMTRAGALGETATAMDEVMHTTALPDVHAGFNGLDQTLAGRGGEQERDDGTTATLVLNITNALWGQTGTTFLDPFLETLATNYGAGMNLVDYVADAEAARVEINDWVADHTEHRITDLIPEGALSSLTRLVLTDAVYLLAPWEHPFEDESTEPAPFTRLDGSKVDSDMMRLSADLRYARVGELQAVELPYVGQQLAMLVLVPDDGSFVNIESTLGSELLADVVDSLEGRTVRLGLPRFEFRTQAGLADTLRSLGMAIAFDPDAADFGAMTTEERLFISAVVHEAFISVDEEGTEAAAATAVVMAATSAPPTPVELTVDRPFVFVLRDTETGAILFLGRVLDPTT